MCALTLTVIHFSHNLLKFGEKGLTEENKGQKKKNITSRGQKCKGWQACPKARLQAFKLYWVKTIILFNPFIPENFTPKMVFEAGQVRALSILFELASQTSQVVKRIPVLITAIQPDQSSDSN